MLQPRPAGREDPRCPGRLRHRRRRREKRPAQIRPGVGLVQKREENQARRLPAAVRPPRYLVKLRTINMPSKTVSFQ